MGFSWYPLNFLYQTSHSPLNILLASVHSSGKEFLRFPTTLHWQCTHQSCTKHLSSCLGVGGSPHSSGRGVGQGACLTSTYVQPRSVQAVMLWGVIPNHSSSWAFWCCCTLFTRFRQTGYQPLSPMCPYTGFPPSLFLSSWSLSSAFYDHFPNPSMCKPLVSGYIKGNPGWENHCTPTA